MLNIYDIKYIYIFYLFKKGYIKKDLYLIYNIV